MKSGGKAAYKRVTVKAILPDGVTKKIFVAPPRQVFGEAGIESIVNQVADALEKDFPDLEFRPVQVAPNAFNFVHAGAAAK